MLSKIDKEILSYLLNKYPEEGCGILLNNKGKLEWVPCENVAEDKKSSFVLESSTYIKAHLKGTIQAIVHSHIDSSPELSEADKKASEFLRIPYIVYSIPEGKTVQYIPDSFDVNNLYGRDYEFGVRDCYTLARDYYLKEQNIVLPILDFKDNWWEEGLNYFDDHFQEFGFKEVTRPEKHDAVLFSVRSQIPNHCAIYLGEGVILHHAENRLSCKESLYPFWAKHITRYLRYANS